MGPVWKVKKQLNVKLPFQQQEAEGIYMGTVGVRCYQSPWKEEIARVRW